MSVKEFEVRDTRKRDKFSIDDFYLDIQARICGIYSTGVYVSLCRHASQSQECFPSTELISKELNISPRQVFRALKILEAHNVIKRSRVGKKLNNLYYLLDRSEWVVDNPISDVPDSHITPDPQAHHPLTDRHIHSKDSHVKDSHIRLPRAEAAGVDKSFASKRKQKHTPEDFNALKAYQMNTWKLAGGEYPWSRLDAGMLTRLLFYGLPTAMALLDLFWVEIKNPANKWVLDNVGRNAKGLLHMLPRLMDMPDVKIRAERHQRAILAAIPGADLKTGDDLAKKLASGFQVVPRGPDHDAQRRSALDKADTIKPRKEAA